MKWKDFKELVERNGVKDDDDIRFIDCNLFGDVTLKIRQEGKNSASIVNGWDDAKKN